MLETVHVIEQAVIELVAQLVDLGFDFPEIAHHAAFAGGRAFQRNGPGEGMAMQARERAADETTRSEPATPQEIARLERLEADLGEPDLVTTTERGRYVLETIEAFLDEVAEQQAA